MSEVKKEGLCAGGTAQGPKVKNGQRTALHSDASDQNGKVTILMKGHGRLSGKAGLTLAVLLKRGPKGVAPSEVWWKGSLARSVHYLRQRGLKIHTYLEYQGRHREARYFLHTPQRVARRVIAVSVEGGRGLDDLADL